MDMIEITQKALRFARIAAEQQPAFASDPQVAIIEREEKAFSGKSASERIGHFVEVSPNTAAFCVRVILDLLRHPDRFDSPEWDGNDFAYLQAASGSLQNQLLRLNARSL